MELILVSSCLLGQPVRYDGGDKRCRHDILKRWIEEGRVVSACPELAGGLPVPRPAAEIVRGTGKTVLAGRAKVMDVTSHDVSEEFVKGARHTVEKARTCGIRVAVLKEGSPSCGSSSIYDGTFTGNKVQGPGVTAALLLEAGLLVFGEAELERAHAALMQLETRGRLHSPWANRPGSV